MSRMDAFERDLEQLLNRHSMENDSSTPDFVLARYLVECLGAWNAAVGDRERWYGRPIQVLSGPSEEIAQAPEDPAKSS